MGKSGIFFAKKLGKYGSWAVVKESKMVYTKILLFFKTENSFSIVKEKPQGRKGVSFLVEFPF